MTRKNVEGPDHPIGWVVALACFFINFICAGLARTAGVLFVALIDMYGVSRESATIPFSIRVCVRNLTGPLIGLLGLRFGIRPVTTAGGFVAGLGSILCYFAPNIFWITAFWGVIHGLGFGLCTVIHMMIISKYFDKYRASALGLGYSGDCFGTFVFPVVMEYLLKHYHLKGTFLILGGIVLNVIPMALLLKTPSWLENNKKTGSYSQNIVDQNDSKYLQQPAAYKNEAFLNMDEDSKEVEEIVFEKKCSNQAVFKLGVEQPIYENVRCPDRRVNCLKSEVSSINNSVRSYKSQSEISEAISEAMEERVSLPPVFEKETDASVEDKEDSNSKPTQFHCEEDEACKDGNQVQQPECRKKSRSQSFISQMAYEIVHRVRTGSFASQAAQDGFISNIQPDQDDKHEDIFPDINDFKPAEQEDQTPGYPNVSIYPTDQKYLTETSATRPLETENEHERRSVFKTLLSTNQKPIFILISVTMAVYGFLFVGVLTIIIDYAVDEGISYDKGKFLIIGFSVTDFIGRISFGFVIDMKLVKLKNYAGVTMMLMGTLVFAIPLNKSFNYMMVCMCMYGLVQGGTAIMFPILVNNYMEKSEESVAMGSLNFYGGLLMLTLAPMIGFFRDNTGSYNGVFFILGGLVLLVGIIWQFEPLILKFQRRNILTPKFVLTSF